MDLGAQDEALAEQIQQDEANLEQMKQNVEAPAPRSLCWPARSAFRKRISTGRCIS